METILFFVVAIALAYVVVYTPVGDVFASFKGAEVQQGNDKLVIPEDSALKRHFLTQLKAEVEMELAPRPTCSMLKRHYDALVLVEMENRLGS